MEKNVLPRPEVVRELDKFIPVELYTDRPRADDERNQKLLASLLKTATLPDYAVVSPEGVVIKATQGRRSSQDMVAFLQQAQADTTRVAAAASGAAGK